MKDVIALFIVLAILIAGCSIPVIIGLSVSRRLKKRNPDSIFLKKQKSGDLWLAVVVTAVLLVGLAARQLAPEGMIASFLRTPFGVVGDVMVLVLAGTAIGAVLSVLRHLLHRRKESDHA